MDQKLWVETLRISLSPRLIGSLGHRYSRVRNVLSNGLLSALAEQLILRKLRNRKDWLPQSNIELTFRIEQRLRALQDRESVNRWLHYRWVEIFNQLLEDIDGMIDRRKGFNYLCLGAGSRNGLSFPLLMFMAGAEHTYIVEPDCLGLGESWRAIWGLQEMVLRLVTRRVDSEYFVRDIGMLSQFLSLSALFTNQEVHTVLNPMNVTLCECYFEDAEIPSRSVDLLTSRSTLEHISEYESCFDKLERIMNPGGVMYHHIDLTSHSSLDPFAFYYHSADGTRGRKLTGLNELRVSDYLQQFEKRGFECSVRRQVMQCDYRLARKKIKPRFQRYSDDDLLCSGAVIIARKKV